MNRHELIDELAKITDKHLDVDTQGVRFYRINCASEILTYLEMHGYNIPPYEIPNTHDTSHSQPVQE